MALVYGFKCGNCHENLPYSQQMEVGHIEARALGKANNGKINNHVSNLIPLCKPCNLAMAKKGIEFFEDVETQNFILEFAKVTAFANDVRTIFKNGIKGRFGQIVTMEDVREHCEDYVLKTDNKTFVRRYRDGVYK